MEFFATYSNKLQELAAFVSIGVILPSAGVFLASQLLRISLMRQENHKYLHGLYNEFLMLDLQYPELGVGYYDTPPKGKLSAAQRAQKDTAFDFLTSMFETAFLTYRARLRTSRSSQWRGWELYFSYYVSRDDYLDWWARVFQECDANWASDSARAGSWSQYDSRFEAYMTTLIDKALAARKPDSPAPPAIIYWLALRKRNAPTLPPEP